MATTLISIGPTLNILQSVVYAIPATPVRIVTGSIVQYSNLIGGPFADIANNAQIKAGFIQCVVGNTTVTLTKVKMKKSVYFNQVISDGATAFWKLDETSGLVAKDSAGNKDGVISGGVTLGQIGVSDKAMVFNGVDGKIDTSIPLATPLTETFTIEFWIKTLGATQQPVLSNRGVAGATFYAGIAAPGTIFLFLNPSPAGGGPTNGIKSIRDNILHHVVFVVYPSEVRGYVDSVLDVTQATGIRTGLGIGGVARIGWDAESVTNWYNGLADNIAYYPKALTPAQILDHYNAGK